MQDKSDGEDAQEDAREESLDRETVDDFVFERDHHAPWHRARQILRIPHHLAFPDPLDQRSPDGVPIEVGHGRDHQALVRGGDRRAYRRR